MDGSLDISPGGRSGDPSGSPAGTSRAVVTINSEPSPDYKTADKHFIRASIHGAKRGNPTNSFTLAFTLRWYIQSSGKAESPLSEGAPQRGEGRVWGKFLLPSENAPKNTFKQSRRRLIMQGHF